MSFTIQKLCKVLATGIVAAGAVVCAQEPAKEPAKTETKTQDDSTAKAKGEEKEKLPFQIRLLETRVRFEANGDSRKEVYTAVKINDAGGARQFARLAFDYNRAFQNVEIPLVKILHANGGTSEILPSAIGDVPNPAVEKFPAYQDVRVKTVRILGLQEGDTLEYRVITTTTKPPLAPDFWLEHTFDRSGQVVEEDYYLTLPQWLVLNEIEASSSSNPIRLPLLEKQRLRMYVSPETPASVRSVGDNLTRSLLVYSWKIPAGKLKEVGTETDASKPMAPDFILTTFNSWTELSGRLSRSLAPDTPPSQAIDEKRRELAAKGDVNAFRSTYEFVSQLVKTVALPLGATEFRTRPPAETLASGYGTPEDKIVLLCALLHGAENSFDPLLVPNTEDAPRELPRPSVFNYLLMRTADWSGQHVLDPSLGVAPFGMVGLAVRGRSALAIDRLPGSSSDDSWVNVSASLPFPARQHVQVEASVNAEGGLRAKVMYTMRGDNELLLRMAFHQAAKERWNEVAGLLALADGFRGHIESVKASDPMDTEKPFEVEYEITQPKFVDWSKKPVRIPALLPQIALPDAAGKAGGNIELGTPLDVETQMTLRLPEGTTVQSPPGTGVERDYATFVSKYDGHLNTVTAARHVKFVMREIPGERAADYGAFVRAVKLDEAQAIALFSAEKTEKK